MSERGKTKRCCATCHRWSGQESDGMRQCTWAPPLLPFWASISEGNDHDDWTRATDGRSCRTWEEREPCEP